MALANERCEQENVIEQLKNGVNAMRMPVDDLISNWAAMTCPSILQHPAPSSAATEFMADRITYDIYFSTPSIDSAGEARSQLITQLYKRARPVVGQKESTGSSPLFLFAENELFEHSSLLERPSDAEKAHLNAKIIRRHFQAGKQLLAQGTKVGSVHFVFSGILHAGHTSGTGRAGAEYAKAGTR